MATQPKSGGIVISAYQGRLSRVHAVSGHFHGSLKMESSTGAFVSLLRYPRVPWHIIWEPWPHEVGPINSSVLQMGKLSLRDFRYLAEIGQLEGGVSNLGRLIPEMHTFSLWPLPDFLLRGGLQDSKA